MSLSVKNVNFYYSERQILNNISFNAQYGEFVSVLGKNGVGKSTLFGCILGHLKVKSGDITVNSKSIKDMSDSVLAQNIAYIPQSHSPVFNFSVLDMVLMGTASQIGKFATPRQKQIDTALTALDKLCITHLKDRGYMYLSGGERQLVLIARAIAQNAKIILMDEPSSSLDFSNKFHVVNMVKNLTKEGFCIIQSTHEPEQAYIYSDKILALHDGNVLAFGKPKDIICNSIISKLYDINVNVYSIENDKMRICIPN